MTVRALRALYGDEIPERGNIAVALRESLDGGVAGVIGSVAGLLTGAAEPAVSRGWAVVTAGTTCCSSVSPVSVA